MAYNHYFLEGASVSAFELMLLYTGIVADDPQWFNIPHKHDFCELLYVIKGSGVVRIEQKEYNVGAGDLMLVNPGIMHEERSNEGDPIYFAFLGIQSFRLEGMPENHIVGVGECPVIPLQRHKEMVERLFVELINETSGRVMFYELISRNIATMLLLQIERILLSGGGECPGELSAECRKIKDFIDGNYNTSVTLDELAKKVYISKYHASHIFKNETGISPIRYLIERRIEAAKTMLTDTDRGVAEISLAVGYDDPVYFSQIFKKLTGAAPSKYRAAHRTDRGAWKADDSL